MDKEGVRVRWDLCQGLEGGHRANEERAGEEWSLARGRNANILEKVRRNQGGYA